VLVPHLWRSPTPTGATGVPNTRRSGSPAAAKDEDEHAVSRPRRDSSRRASPRATQHRLDGAIAEQPAPRSPRSVAEGSESLIERRCVLGTPSLLATPQLPCAVTLARSRIRSTSSGRRDHRSKRPLAAACDWAAHRHRLGGAITVDRSARSGTRLGRASTPSGLVWTVRWSTSSSACEDDRLHCRESLAPVT
jgi:hypothetical protein